MSGNENKAGVGAGDVPIMLDGEEFVLRPTYAAAKLLSSRYEGIIGVMQKVMQLDIEAVEDVIAVGLGYTPPRRPPKDLAERIYRTGLTEDTGSLAERCTYFLRILANGGQPPSESEEFEEDATSADPTQS